MLTTNLHHDSLFRRNFLMGVSLLTLSVELHAAAILSGNTADPSTLGTGNYNIGIDATGTPNPGTMLIDGGSAVVGQIIKLGVNQNAQGVATVTGTNSSLSATQLYLGYGSATTTNTQGTLNIWSGAKASTATNVSYVGYGASSTGTINVTGTADGTLTGAPSTLTLGTTTHFGYGYNASGTLNITDGGSVAVTPMGRNGGPIVLGSGSGSTGTILVSGANSSYSGKGTLFVGSGSGGQGIINVTNGGILSQTSTSTASTTIGSTSGSGSGTVTVSGSSSAFNTSGNFVVGTLGTGTFNVTNGATAQGTFNTAYTTGANFGTGQIGSNTGSSGTVNVSGVGSIWTTVGNLYIGYLGAGRLNIQSGGTVNSALNNVGALTDYENMTLAYGDSSSATVLVDGPGSAWNVTGTGGGNIMTGAGTTTITVRNGGTANLADVFLNGNSTITITGANSVMTTGRFILSAKTGVASYPTIAISNGGVLNNTQLASLAQNPATNQPIGGAVSVDGSTSQWNVAGDLIVGRSGSTALITLKNGGTLSVYTDPTHQATGIGDCAIILGDTPGGSTPGIPPSVGILYIGTGAAAGIVNAASVGGYFSGNTVIPAADSTILFNHNQNNYYFTNNGTSSGTGVAITGSTKINVVAGVTVLTANNTNVGDTLVTGGNLIVNNPGGAGTSGTGSGNVTVSIHGTLGGAGRITPADVTISSGGYGNVTTSHSVDVLGILSPGDISSFGASIPGTLTIDSGHSSAAHILTLESGATLQFDLGAGLTSDRISLLNGSVADLLFNSNIINFTDLTSGHLASGDYVLFSAGDLADYSGLFSATDNSVTGLSIGSGLETYQAHLAMSGTNLVLEVAAVPEPSTWALLGLGFGPLLFRFRVRRRFLS